jgi:hypothetical protein
MTTLSAWVNFYTIVGSSAGALIGLQFVVMTLAASMPIKQADSHAGHTFTTPTVVHFGVVLFLSATACAPWEGVVPVAVCWGLVGLCGMLYVAVVAGRIRTQTTYQAVFEDRLFHVLLPFAAYALLAASACAVFLLPHLAMFLAAAVALLLLFIGIHNAWDTVTYHVFVRKYDQGDDERQR